MKKWIKHLVTDLREAVSTFIYLRKVRRKDPDAYAQQLAVEIAILEGVNQLEPGHAKPYSDIVNEAAKRIAARE